MPPGSIVAGKCYYCWPASKEGDCVVVRKIICYEQLAQPNEKVTVKTILGSEDGLVFIGKVDSGKDAFLVRTELRKQRDNEA